MRFLFDAGLGFAFGANTMAVLSASQRSGNPLNGKDTVTLAGLFGALLTLIHREGDIRSVVPYILGFFLGLLAGARAQPTDRDQPTPTESYSQHHNFNS